MDDPTYILYTALKRKFPAPSDPVNQDLTQSLEEIQTKIKDFPPNYEEIVWDLEDCLASLSAAEALHAFTLGLDYGLSLMEKLRPYPDIVM